MQIGFESLLSTAGSEYGMLGDHVMGVRWLSKFSFRLKPPPSRTSAVSPSSRPAGVSSRRREGWFSLGREYGTSDWMEGGGVKSSKNPRTITSSKCSCGKWKAAMPRIDQELAGSARCSTASCPRNCCVVKPYGFALCYSVKALTSVKPLRISLGGRLICRSALRFVLWVSPFTAPVTSVADGD
jgi:hypothetical protein